MAKTPAYVCVGVSHGESGMKVDIAFVEYPTNGEPPRREVIFECATCGYLFSVACPQYFEDILMWLKSELPYHRCRKILSSGTVEL